MWGVLIGVGVDVGAGVGYEAAGEVRELGLVFVGGELWQAHASDGTQLLAGEHVEVDALNGLELTVTPKR